MTIAYQFGNVGAHGALIRAWTASLGAERHAIVDGARAAGDFWGGPLR
jgi:hypothetical protein